MHSLALYFLLVLPRLALSTPVSDLPPRAADDDVVSPGLPHDPLRDVSVPSLDYWEERAAESKRTLCYLRPSDDEDKDDAPALLKVFNEECRKKSIIVLPGPVYHIQTPMNTTDLDDVEIHQFGRLLWSQDVDYWLTVSMPIDFQNQSTVWNFGGQHVTWDGHRSGTMDGNGQVWYDWAKSKGNLAHRPMNINFRGFRDSTLRRLRFVQSQMWTMTIQWSANLVLEDMYVNSTSTSQYSTLNTDGADTMYSDNITFARWRVTNGDDAIALKANSTNIRLYDSEFWHSTGIAVGSMGQFKDHVEHIAHFHVRNVTMHNVIWGCYFKSWTGVQTGYPPNGGGGGLGHARDVLVEDIVLDHTRSQPLRITQCESYNGHNGENCFTSEFEIGDIIFRNWTGYSRFSEEVAGLFRCSEASGGCHNVTIENWTVKKGPEEDAEPLDAFECHNMHDYKGFECNKGKAVEGTAAVDGRGEREEEEYHWLDGTEHPAEWDAEDL